MPAIDVMCNHCKLLPVEMHMDTLVTWQVSTVTTDHMLPIAHQLIRDWLFTHKRMSVFLVQHTMHNVVMLL